jgi:hypothetical protein
LILGYIDADEIADPITGLYTWNELNYWSGLDASSGILVNDSIAGLLWVDEIQSFVVCTNSDSGCGIALINESGTMTATYNYNVNAGMPLYGARDCCYCNGSLWFTFPYDSSHPDRRGLAQLDLATEQVTYHEPNWWTCETECGLHYLVPMGDDQRILMVSTGGDCEGSGVVIFDTADSSWTVFNKTTLPGMFCAGAGNVCDQWTTHYGKLGVQYDSTNQLIYASYPGYVNGDNPCGVIVFSETGGFSTLRYSTVTTPAATPSYAAAADLSYYDFESSPAIAFDSDGYMWLTWHHLDSQSEYDLMWANSMSDMALQDYFDTAVDLVIKWEFKKITSLSFALSRGHLLDPLNYSSTWHIYLAKGRKLTLEIGERVSSVDYYQDQGEFLSDEIELTYSLKKYPSISVDGRDKRCLHEDALIIASEYFSGETPKTVVENLLVDHGDMESGEYNVPTFAWSHDIYKQFVDMTLEEALELILDHLGYFSFVNVDGEYEPRQVRLSGSPDHTYTSSKIIEYTPDQSYSSFVNRIIVTGMSNLYSEVLYEEQCVKSGIAGTIGWWGSDEDIKVWYSDDQQDTCRSPRLEILQSVSEFQVWGIRGGGGEQISDTDEDEHYVIITIEAPNLVGVLIGTIAAIVALGVACSECGESVFSWCGVCIYTISVLLSTVLYILGAVASYSYNLWARPIGHERKTFQASADDEDFQQELNGKIVTESIDDSFCYTIAQCQIVADYELSVVMAQRRKLKLKKTMHLQDELGDIIRFNHPYSGEQIDILVTALERRIKFGDDASATDTMEGWRLI